MEELICNVAVLLEFSNGRPLWVEYPSEAANFAEQEQYLVGSDLLVAPVLRPQSNCGKLRCVWRTEMDAGM